MLKTRIIPILISTIPAYGVFKLSPYIIEPMALNPETKQLIQFGCAFLTYVIVRNFAAAVLSAPKD